MTLLRDITFKKDLESRRFGAAVGLADDLAVQLDVPQFQAVFTYAGTLFGKSDFHIEDGQVVCDAGKTAWEDFNKFSPIKAAAIVRDILAINASL